MTSNEAPGDALGASLKRTELQRAVSSIPGREIVQVLTEIPAGVESGWHMHPGEEVGYILAGNVQMEIEDTRLSCSKRAIRFSCRREHPTTRRTSGPTPARCSPPTSLSPTNRSPRSRATPPRDRGAAASESGDRASDRERQRGAPQRGRYRQENREHSDLEGTCRGSGPRPGHQRSTVTTRPIGPCTAGRTRPSTRMPSRRSRNGSASSAASSARLPSART